MIVDQNIFWNILDYIFQNTHFIENPMNPKDITALEFSEEGKGVWLKSILEKFADSSSSKEAVLTVFHILETTEMIRCNYVAAYKDHRIMDLSAKGYEVYLKHKGIL